MIANYHTHTWRCNHAEGRESEYVQCALRRGLQILGFSDHTPYIFPGEYYSTFRMKMTQLDDYVKTVQSLREDYQGQIQIHLGPEAEFYPKFFPELLEILRDHSIEYLLLGQHFLGNEIGEPGSGNPTADASILKRYCTQAMDAMQTGLFTYFAHPDLLNFQGDRRIYEQNMRRLCREANSCRIPLEINLLGLRNGRNYPNRVFLELAAEEGCRMVLGCDAHEPKALSDTSAEEKAMALTAEYGLEVLETVPLRPIR